jgi:hypothetical protein
MNSTWTTAVALAAAAAASSHLSLLAAGYIKLNYSLQNIINKTCQPFSGLPDHQFRATLTSLKMSEIVHTNTNHPVIPLSMD